MKRYVRIYMLLNTLAAYSFIFFIISPLYAADMGISLEWAGAIFSTVYAVQAIMSYLLGRLFEKISPNTGIIIGRFVFSLGALTLAFTSSPVFFTLALILASFFDIFFPSIPLFERALVPPSCRERFYVGIITIGEMGKLVGFVALLIVRGGEIFYRVFFLSVFAASFAYALVFKFVIPRVETGSDVHEDQTVEVDPRTFLLTMLNQLFVFLAFNFASWMIISYYLKVVLGGDQKDMVIFEIMFSLGVVAAFVVRDFLLRLPLKHRLFLGTSLMASLFFIIPLRSLGAFYASNLLFGFGFVYWLSSKEPLKFASAPRELGRWEGLFQGINILSRIFFPTISAFVASNISYTAVFLTGGAMVSLAALLSLGVRS